MAELSLKILDKDGNTLAVSKGEDFVELVYAQEYALGDVIELQSSEYNREIRLQVDDALGAALVYVTGVVQYAIPFGEKRISYSPKVFYGNRHYIYAEIPREDEVNAYRNLALNPADQHGSNSRQGAADPQGAVNPQGAANRQGAANQQGAANPQGTTMLLGDRTGINCFPHATANVETRGESVFAAKNAIDGVRANLSHGEWPYESWGINRQADARMRVDYGREVEIDKIVLYLRSDFPHDSWWNRVSLTFSDGSSETFSLEKSERAHVLPIKPRRVCWVEFGDLIKADDPSPFPALSQIETYGHVV